MVGSMMQSSETQPNRSRRAVIVAIGCALVAARAQAQDAALPEGSFADRVAKLKPGAYLWAPELAPDGPILIIVSLEAQRAYVYRNGLPIGVATVSTGKDGYKTPTGVFTILQKQVDHKSNLYDDAPMPYMQRLTWSGVAMHAGNLPGYPASHGCIRLPLGFAKLLYGVTRLGLTVVITDKAEIPKVAPTPAVLLAAISPEATPQGAVSWTPERAPQGPLSIVISAADKRMVVLRNGVIIGSAPVTIAGQVDGPSAYTLRAIDHDGFHWLQLSLPAAASGRPLEVTAQERERLRLPEDFRGSLASVLTPGATVVVTPDTLQTGSTGEQLTIMTGDDK